MIFLHCVFHSFNPKRTRQKAFYPFYDSFLHHINMENSKSLGWGNGKRSEFSELSTAFYGWLRRRTLLTLIILLLPAEGDINDVLIKTLAEAHANTNIKLEVVHEMFRKPQVGFTLPTFNFSLFVSLGKRFFVFLPLDIPS
jgi:hypothetical protein